METEADIKTQLNEVLRSLENVHFPSGPNYIKNHKLEAILCMKHNKNNELEVAYNLVESLAPSLRFHAVFRYDKALRENLQRTSLPLGKDNLNFNCSNLTLNNKIEVMLKKLSEMPKEWTIVQLTSQFNSKENLEVSSKNFHTSPLHITVFNCSRPQIFPFTVTVDAPKDTINGSNIEIRQEMHSIIAENLNTFQYMKKKVGKFISQADKQAYCKNRFLLNSRLENIVRQIQNKWLGVWRCLLVGKLCNNKIEESIVSVIEEVLREESCQNKTDKIKNLLKFLINASNYLTMEEIKTGLRYIFPQDIHKDLRVTLARIIQNFSNEHDLSQEIRHPLMLIVDEKLDFIPWEMIDVLQNHPVSRMPSLHLAYALFKEHEDSIVNGWKININPKKGTYIINPGLDLKEMEVRLSSFFKYWLPNWNGLKGVTPSETEFQNMLSNNDIFIYSGHGNGTQFLSGEKISKLKVNAVVFLFGCGSVQLQLLGPQVEMHSSYYMYLIACSPCILGSLWAITDIDTDVVTAQVLSQWIPSEASKHWKLVDEKKWRVDGSVNFVSKRVMLKESDKHEPELLRALCKARKSAKQYLVQAAFVARGLPVKIQD